MESAEKPSSPETHFSVQTQSLDFFRICHAGYDSPRFANLFRNTF